MTRQSTGVPGLDDLLGGGLLPGTLTLVVGATGIGKTQLGLQFAAAGRRQEGRGGAVLDMSARGDGQAHAAYARRMFGWEPAVADPRTPPEANGFFSPGREHGEYLRIFEQQGRRVSRRDLDFDEWHEWQAALNARLRTAIAFFYGNFVRGTRRVVVDGIEPAERPADSIQWHLLEYVYHQIVRKESEWVARDLFRETYRQHADEAARHAYDPGQVGCVVLATSHEMLLEDLIPRRIDDSELAAAANTLIYMGKVRQGDAYGRALYVAKHRGSACDDRVVPYTIDDRGLRIAQRCREP
jgi:KaiC/GvpD/RAD55 family RecA-like ATPase